MENTKTVRLTVKDGVLEYYPPVLHAKHEHSVQWTCVNPFAIQFTGVSPLAAAEFHNGDPAVPVRPDAGPGGYKYAVAIFDGTTVYLDACCPVIIID